MSGQDETLASDSSGQEQPVGQGDYAVRQGECMESIAYERGFFWETLWNLPENAELRRRRKNPDILLPGDQVHVPDKREVQVAGATEQTHRFRRKGVPSKVHLVIERNGEARANVPYVLDVDGLLFSDKTNERGEIEHCIPPNAKKGKLTLGEGDDQEEYELALGHLDPIEDVKGVQARLNNLGFGCGTPDGRMSPQTVFALKSFQESVNLPATGEIDQATRDALASQHGT